MGKKKKNRLRSISLIHFKTALSGVLIPGRPGKHERDWSLFLFWGRWWILKNFF